MLNTYHTQHHIPHIPHTQLNAEHVFDMKELPTVEPTIRDHGTFNRVKILKTITKLSPLVQMTKIGCLSDHHNPNTWKYDTPDLIVVIDGTVGAVADQSTVALRVAGTNPARNKYLYGLHKGNSYGSGSLCMWLFCNRKKRIHDTGSILRQGKSVQKNNVWALTHSK